MRDPVPVLNMFSDYEPPELLKNAFAQAVIVAAEVDPETRSVTAVLSSPAYIPQRYADELSAGIADAYGLKALQLTCTHPAGELTKIEPAELMALFVEEDSMSRGALAGALWKWIGDSLTIQLRANGKDALCKCIPAVCEKLRQRFSAEPSIEIIAGADLKGTALFEAMEKMRSSVLNELPKVTLVAKKEQKNDIMKAIMEKAGAETKAKSIVFSLPVTDTAGLRLIED